MRLIDPLVSLPPEAMGRVFKVEYPIRFSHCDPAGIVYFPRFFDLLHEAMEDWFKEALQTPLHELISAQGLGTPTVSTQCDFLSPARFGDTLRVELSVLRLGNASVELLVEAWVAERACFKCRHTICLFDRNTAKAIALPEALRHRIRPYVAAAAASTVKNRV
jgi:4-hydroxybenzoyl-CoA thioesterase